MLSSTLYYILSVTVEKLIDIKESQTIQNALHKNLLSRFLD